MQISSEQLKGAKVLVVDDHRNIRFSLRLALEAEGVIVDEADSVGSAKAKLSSCERPQDFAYHLVFLDIRLPDGSGLELLRILSAVGLASRVIMISGEGTVGDAFQATQMGAFDYVEKPFSAERILVTMRRCLDFNQIKLENENLNQQVRRGQEILGRDPSVDTLHAAIAKVAPTNGRILIQGESGTGKELVARQIHRLSQRAGRPLVKVNCAAIPHSLIESELFGHEKGAFTGAIKVRKGLFEQADHGTLFLDEIGELSLDVQAKLLRVLQNGEVTRLGSEKVTQVDVRLLTATHRDLEFMVAEGQFREDLFYRLNVLSIEVPPLRERGDDVLYLAEEFLKQACEEHSIGERSFSEAARHQMKAYHWPGNIRQLKNVIERAAILADHAVIEVLEGIQPREPAERQNLLHTEATPESQRPRSPLDSTSEGIYRFETGPTSWQDFHQHVDKGFLKYILENTNGNVSEASRILCLERAYLHRLMKKLGVQRGVVVSGD